MDHRATPNFLEGLASDLVDNLIKSRIKRFGNNININVSGLGKELRWSLRKGMNPVALISKV